MNGVPLNINFGQILLHLFNFAVLFAALYFILYKPVKKFMDNRASKYQEMEDRANLNLKEAESKNEELDKKIKDFDLEAKELKANLRAEMNKEKSHILEEAKREAEEILINAEKEAEIKKLDALKNAEKEMIDIIIKGAEKVTTGATPSDAFDEFLKETEN